MVLLLSQASKAISKYNTSISTVLFRGLNWLFLILLPVFGGYEVAGQFTAQWSVAMLLCPLVNLGMAKAFLRYSNEQSLSDMQSCNVLLMGFHFSASFVVLSTFFSSNLLQAGVETLSLSSFIALRQGRLNFLNALLTKRQNKAYTVNQVVVSLGQFVISMYFLLFGKEIAHWLLLTNLLLALQFLQFFQYSIKIGMKEIKLMKMMLLFSWPYLISSTIGVLSITFDKLYMLRYFPIEQLGILAAVQSLANAIAFIAAPLIVFFEPTCYTCKPSELKRTVRKFIISGTLLASTALGFIFIVSHFFFERIFDMPFSPVRMSLLLYGIAHVLNYPYLALQFILARKKKSKGVMLPALVMPAIVVLFGIFLIPKFGVFGSAFAMFVGAAGQSGLSWYLANKQLRLYIDHPEND